jgi:general L-amino acid transport system substrate-binding protein
MKSPASQPMRRGFLFGHKRPCLVEGKALISSLRQAAGGVVAVAVIISGSVFAQTSTAPAAPPSVQGTTEKSPEETTLGRVRARGHLTCGSPQRPGLAMLDPKGRWNGLEVEICRAVAAAVFGPDAPFVYHGYDTDKDYDHVRDGDDDVSFLAYEEMLEKKLTDKQMPGPAVFIETNDLMVHADAKFRDLNDLIGKSICFMSASDAERALQAYYLQRKVDMLWMPYWEDEEMNDAYNVARCEAVAGESTTLALTRLANGINKVKSRVMSDHLSVVPILATTPLKDDARWAAITAWTFYTLLDADRVETDYKLGGIRSITLASEGLGLSKDWQKTVVDKLGSYTAIFRRTLGAESPFKLEPGLNRRLAEGGALVAPTNE